MAKGVGATLTVIGSAFWTEPPFESCNVKSVALVTAPVGTPVIAPVGGSNVSPDGSCGEPGDRLQVYGGVPPAEVSVMLYDWFTVPAGNGAGVRIVNGPGAAGPGGGADTDETSPQPLKTRVAASASRTTEQV